MARPLVGAFDGFTFVRNGASNEKEILGVVVPTSPDTVKAVVIPVPLPTSCSAQRTSVAVAHPEVTHDVVPTRTVTVGSLEAKFNPPKVTVDAPVAGPFGLEADTTGASKVNSVEDAVPTSWAIVEVQLFRRTDVVRGTLSHKIMLV